MPSHATPGEVVRYPVLPLRDIVVFPGMTVPLFVGREPSVRAVEAATKAEKPLLLVTQMSAKDDDPGIEGIYKTGTIAAVLQLLNLRDGTVKALVEGRSRVRVHRYIRTDLYEAEAETIADEADASEALARSALAAFEDYVRLDTHVSREVAAFAARLQDRSRLADTIVSHLAAKSAEKQAVLETTSVSARFEMCLALIESEVSVLRSAKPLGGGIER